MFPAADTQRSRLRQVGRVVTVFVLATMCAAAWTVQPARADASNGAPTLTLSPASVSVQSGQQVTLTATVTTFDGSSPSGPVYFCTGGTASCGAGNSLGSAQLGPASGSQATATYTFTAGSGTPATLAAGWPYMMFGIIASNVTSSATSVSVTSTPSLLSTTIALTGSTSIRSDESATFTATVSNGTGTPPTGTVQFYDNGLSLGTATLANGAASFSAGGFAGNTTHSIAAKYLGDATNAPSNESSSVTLSVASVETTVSTTISAGVSPSRVGAGGSATLNATVLQAGTSLAPTNGLVTFWNGGNSVTQGTPDAHGHVSIATGGWLPGNYTIRASYVGDSNAATKYGASSASFSFVVATALTVQAPSPTTTYGDSPPALVPSYSGFLSGGSASSLATQPTCTTTESSTSPVGTYPVTCGGGSDPAYDFVYDAGTLTVAPRNLTFSPANVTVPFGTDPTASLGVVFSGFVNGDGPSAVTGSPACVTSATSASPVGTYTYTCGVGTLTAQNYTLVSSGTTGTLTIVSPTLDVTAPSPQVAYGSGPPAVLAPSYSGFLPGDSASSLATQPTCTTTATDASPVGTYPVTCSGGVAAAGDPYTFSYTSGTLTVLKAPLTVTPNDASMTAGDALPPFTSTLSGFVNGDTPATAGVTGSANCTTTTNGATPGTFPITCTAGTLSAPNYSFVPSNGSATLTVKTPGATPTLVFNWTVGPVLVGQPVKLTGSLLYEQKILGVPIWLPAGSQTITLSLGSQSCTAITDAFGSASCTVTAQGPTGWTTSGATYLGNQWYAPSTYTNSLLVYAFPGGGAFLVGDQSALLNSIVTFWGAQWSKANSFSGGSAPDSCKGYASSVGGSNWSTGPGNSSSPPGSLPAYMGVIVTSSAQKSGSQISGPISRIAVVRTNPGYDGNPGHAGTGTVVG